MNILIKASNFVIPAIILTIVLWGMKEKKDVFGLFIDGAKNGMNTIVGLIPTLIGIFFAVGLLRASGVIDLMCKIIYPITSAVSFPSEILPLMIIRPISGSGALGMAVDIITTYGADSYIGRVAAVIMGSTETSLYVIALYTGCLKVKKENKLIYSALIADIAGIICTIAICHFL
ncbi:MAG: spore maturation protein [Clostridia bacterium]|nr:spore maturation protein [Clostridia bacterium]